MALATDPDIATPSRLPHACIGHPPLPQCTAGSLYTLLHQCNSVTDVANNAGFQPTVPCRLHHQPHKPLGTTSACSPHQRATTCFIQCMASSKLNKHCSNVGATIWHTRFSPERASGTPSPVQINSPPMAHCSEPHSANIINRMQQCHHNMKRQYGSHILDTEVEGPHNRNLEASDHPCTDAPTNTTRLTSEEMPCHIPNCLYNALISF